jgi:sulfite reductase (NADPH) flavoprotein alpha-component
LSGFEGVFRERPWKRVDAALDASMRERAVDDVGTWAQRARLLARAPATAGAAPGVQRVDLDVRDQGVVYAPGDRVAIVPEHAPALVGRVVEALRARPDTAVPLTAGWREALVRRGLAEPPVVLELVDLLRVAALRPLPRPVAKALHALSQSPALGRVVEERLEDQLDVADALAMAAAAGYDVRRLTTARPWQAESLAAILPPQGERLYSIASAPTSSRCQEQLVLTVGDLTYAPRPDAGVAPGERHGTGSRWLNRLMDPGHDRVPFRVVRPRRFRLPTDAARPVVMIAGGTGIAPFRGFIASRAAAGGAGPDLLLLSVRRVEDVPYRDELDAWVRAGVLDLDVAVSREERAVRADPVHGVVDGPGTARRIGDLVVARADRLWELLGDAGDGVAYVCGQAGFAHAVLEALRDVAGARLGDLERGEAHVHRLVGRQRLMLDVFTTTAPVRAPGTLGDRVVPASELVTRNDEEAGYWMAIDGGVYDVTGFRHLHPGGTHILVESSGTDATEEYRAVLHHLDGEVGALLAMTKVGVVRRLRLGDAWAVAATGAGLQPVSMADLYRAWVRYAYLVVEMQNAHRNDWTYRHLPLTRGEQEPLTTQKLMLLADTHDRFVVQYLDGVLGDDLVALWASTTALADPSARLDELPGRIAAVGAAPEAAAAADVAAALRRLPAVSRDTGAGADPAFWWAAAALWDDVRRVEERFLARLKDVLRQGLVLFERHEAAVVAEAGAELVALLRAVPSLAADEHGELVAAWRDAPVLRWCP